MRKFPHDTQYFTNRACEYYPCHVIDTKTHGFNCMFCRCPYYYAKDCPGDPILLSNGIKDCGNCTYNHRHENKEELSKVFLSPAYLGRIGVTKK